MALSLKGHIALSVLTLLILRVSSCSAGGTYNVSSSCAETNTSCYTLEAILNGTANISLSGSELDFRKWRYTIMVGQNAAIANIENLTFVGFDTASILCTNNSTFVFTNVTNLRFVDLELVSCRIQLSNASATFNNTTFKDSTATQGGAVAIYNKGNVSFIGQTLFEENKATIAGGAIFSDVSTISFSGNVTFRDNWSGPTGGGAMFTVGSKVWFNGISHFSGNRVTNCTELYGNCQNLALRVYSCVGGALRIINSTFAFNGSTIFVHNQAGLNLNGSGGGIFLDANSVISFDGDTEFLNNSAGCRGNGLYADYSIVSFNGTTFFTSAYRASDGGGAIYLKEWCSLTVQGESKFQRNSAGLGGAFYVWHKNTVKFDGRTTFTHNSADRGAAVRLSINDTLAFSGHTEFSYNTVTYKGGALDFDHGIHAYFEGNTTFIHNAAPTGLGGAIVSLDRNIVDFEGNQSFRCNSAKLGGAINSKIGSSYTFSGNTCFVNNIATVGGGIYMSKGGILRMTENTHFHNNAASYLGGGLAVRNSNVSLKGNTTMTRNKANYGGGIFAQDAALTLVKRGMLRQNNATVDGGAMFASGSIIQFEGMEFVISGNTADRNGGGIALVGFALKVVVLHPHINLYFEHNLAYSRGGAIYVEDNPYVYCEFEGENQTKDSCFMQHKQEICQPDTPKVSDVSAFDKIRLHFVNTAKSIGHVLHGGSLHSCYWCVGRDEYVPGYEAFNFIATRSPDKDFDISSDPFQVRTCSGDSTISVKAFPMETIHVEVNATGQNNITCPADILAVRSGGISNYTSKLDLQPIEKECKRLAYTLMSTNLKGNKKGNIELYAYKPCSTSGFPLKIDVTFRPCPVGFELVNITTKTIDGEESKAEACYCESRLHRFDVECRIQNQTILRRGDFWVGVAERNINNKSRLILHRSHCTFDYCKAEEVRFQLNDTDLQCANNRSGILCGACQSGLSLALGSSHCVSCSNTFLALVIPFFLAGILLVVLLFILEITISTGIIGGLVLYANIVRIHSDIFALDGETNVLTVFIAWVNLDLGIETCFVDGLDAYSRAWLQFVFPVYLWLLAGFVALLANVSVSVAKLIGDTNPISVLATLFLLSYTKILRTVMAAFQFTTLDYPEGETVAVWLYDGNVRYLEGKHIVLFLFSLLVLLVLFLPYSLVLLFGHWIDKFQVRWIPQKYYLRLKAFLDAHHAPLKDSHCYWFGLLLILRFVILLVSAVLDARRPQDPHTNLLVLLLIVSGLQMWGWVFHGVYKNCYLDILEASFIFNLLVLGAGTYQIALSGGDQHALVYISIGVAFVTFLAIVSYFVWVHPVTKSALSYLTARIRPPKPVQTAANAIDTTELIRSDSQGLEPSNAPTVTVIPKPPYHLTHRQSAVSLREPLLETVEI